MDQETFDRLSRSVMMAVSEFNCFLNMKPSVKDIRQQLRNSYNVPSYMTDSDVTSFIQAVLQKAKEIGFVEQSYDTYYIPRPYPGDCPPPSHPFPPPTTTTWSRRVLEKKRGALSSARASGKNRPTFVAKKMPQLGLRLRSKRVKLTRKLQAECFGQSSL